MLRELSKGSRIYLVHILLGTVSCKWSGEVEEDLLRAGVSRCSLASRRPPSILLAAGRARPRATAASPGLPLTESLVFTRGSLK